ncbi:hypothetical protein SODG_005578 [Sodalis praecaptivus]|nr:hypothetical protein NVIRENTERO_04134 [Sodalis praecaptivus]
MSEPPLNGVRQTSAAAPLQDMFPQLGLLSMLINGVRRTGGRLLGAFCREFGVWGMGYGVWELRSLGLTSRPPDVTAGSCLLYYWRPRL